jgi:hypothetical protein
MTKPINRPYWVDISLTKRELQMLAKAFGVRIIFRPINGFAWADETNFEEVLRHELLDAAKTKRIWKRKLRS